MALFERFGEFDSVEELNMTAEGLKEEGDLESLKVLAVENGLDAADAEDYAGGIVPELANRLLAALGKLKMEKKELKPCEIMEDWISYIEVCCSESEEMARAVRLKSKSLEGCIAAVLKWSFAHQYPVPDKIKKAAGVNAGKVTLGIPGSATAKKIIREYYLGKQVI